MFFAGYYGARKMLETYEWYMDRFFDWKVRDFLQKSVVSQFGSHGQIARWAVAKSTKEIAETTRMSESRVRGCLKRLKRKNVITEDDKGFRMKV